MLTHLDHVVLSVHPSALDLVVKRFLQGGFAEHTRRVRHADGGQSVFFLLFNSYIELRTVPTDRATPFLSVWLVSADVSRSVETIRGATGEKLAVRSEAPAGDELPAWRICELPQPNSCTVNVSLIQYLRGAGTQPIKGRGANGIFGIRGVVAHTPKPIETLSFFRRWLTPVIGCGGSSRRVELPSQYLAWKKLRSSFPLVRSCDSPAALLDLLSMDILAAESAFRAGGFEIKGLRDSRLRVRIPELPKIVFDVTASPVSNYN